MFKYPGYWHCTMYTQADTLGRHYWPASDVACASGGRSGHTAPAGGKKAATHVRGGGKPLDRDTAHWKPQVYPVLADLKEILLLPKKLCSWQRDFALGKEILLLAKRICSWQRNFALDLGPNEELFFLALGKDTLTLAKRFSSWQREFALGKDILLLARRFCS